MRTHLRLFIGLIALAFASLACQLITGPQFTPQPSPTTASQPIPTTASQLSPPPPTPALTPTPLATIPIQPGESHLNEPVYVTGKITYTSPFFVNTISDGFVMLEDEAGFVRRDHQFVFPLNDQILGPIQVQANNSLTYSLMLPALPQGTQVDVDNNGHKDTGVQVFAVAYWSNTWGDTFIEPRDGKGWSDAYASTITDPQNNDEIKGGILIVWSPDDHQAFPTGFGPDGLLFTSDDPTAPIPAGYNIVDLNQTPFQVSKTAHPTIDLNEGVVAVNDYSNMNYQDAFEAMFQKVSKEYPFTAEKGINWQALHDEFAPKIAAAKDAQSFYLAIRAFALAIPDEHVGPPVDSNAFLSQYGGGFGLVTAELSDGKVIAANVLPNLPAQKAGIQPGAEIITWDKQPVSDAINAVVPYFSPFSTETARRLQQVAFLTRAAPGAKVDVTFRNPNSTQTQSITMTAESEIGSLLLAIPELNQDPVALPVEGHILSNSGLGYIRINTFNSDDNLMARLWEHYLKGMIDQKTPGIIIDIRVNGGGNALLALDFAGYFFNQKIDLYHTAYYNERTGKFEFEPGMQQIIPGDLQFSGPVAILISPDCVSACEGFAAAMKYNNRSIAVGNYPTAGAFGEVGRGQYKLPGDLTLQFPTGRSETPNGQLFLEGKGITPDITVPVTSDSVLGNTDTVLNAAVQALQKEIK
jgi:C-terminal processing protease CtpA/Prc